MVTPLAGELGPEPGELLPRLFEAGGGLARLLLRASHADLEREGGCRALRDQLLRAQRVLFSLIRRAQRTGETPAKLVELRPQLFDVGRVGRTLRLEDGLGALGIFVVTEELVLQLRSCAVECAGELLQGSGVLGPIAGHLLQRRLPLPLLACELVPGCGGVARRVRSHLLGTKHLCGRLCTGRGDERLVARGGRPGPLDTGERGAEQRADLLQLPVAG